MRSKALNLAFNRALADSQYRKRLLHNLRGTLLEAGVPDAEVRALEQHAPTDLETLAQALEAVHAGPPSRALQP